MKIENQVCTLEQAKRLKELGIEAVPLYWHYCGFMTEKHGIVQYDFILRYNSANAVYPAFTVAELGAMLGLFIDNVKHVPSEWFDTMIIKYGERLSVCYNPLFIADYVIYVLENNLITATDCNNRLNSDI